MAFIDLWVIQNSLLLTDMIREDDFKFDLFLRSSKGFEFHLNFVHISYTFRFLVYSPKYENNPFRRNYIEHSLKTQSYNTWGMQFCFLGCLGCQGRNEISSILVNCPTFEV